MNLAVRTDPEAKSCSCRAQCASSIDRKRISSISPRTKFELWFLVIQFFEPFFSEPISTWISFARSILITISVESGRNKIVKNNCRRKTLISTELLLFLYLTIRRLSWDKKISFQSIQKGLIFDVDKEIRKFLSKVRTCI